MTLLASELLIKNSQSSRAELLCKQCRLRVYSPRSSQVESLYKQCPRLRLRSHLQLVRKRPSVTISIFRYADTVHAVITSTSNPIAPSVVTSLVVVGGGSTATSAPTTQVAAATTSTSSVRVACKFSTPTTICDCGNTHVPL